MINLGYNYYIEVSDLVRTEYGERVSIKISDGHSNSGVDIYNTTSGAPGDYRWMVIRHIESTFTNRDDYNPVHTPRLESNVEAYIKRQRDKHRPITIPISRLPRDMPQEVQDYIFAIRHNAKHEALDDLLDDYRVRASTGTSLEEEENGYPV